MRQGRQRERASGQWSSATKTWIPEGNLPAGLRYDDEELVPDYDDGMIDIQAAMEKQLMLACRMIRGMEQERDHLKGKMAEQGRLLERRNSTINELLEQVRETQGQLREAQDQLADWRSWWDRWEWDGTRWRRFEEEELQNRVEDMEKGNRRDRTRSPHPPPHPPRPRTPEQRRNPGGTEVPRGTPPRSERRKL